MCLSTGRVGKSIARQCLVRPMNFFDNREHGPLRRAVIGNDAATNQHQIRQILFLLATHNTLQTCANNKYGHYNPMLFTYMLVMLFTTSG